MAEINGLLNRHTVLKPYRGFESLPHRKTVPDNAPSLYAFIFFTVAAIDQYYSAQANNLQLNLDKHNSGSSASNKYGIPNSLLKRIIGGPVFYLAF